MSPEARRAQLLELGSELLLAEPLENLTVLRLANQAGVSRALVFHYFPTVRDLHLACLEVTARQLVDTIVEVTMADRHGDPLGRGLHAFVDYLNRQPMTFLSMAGYSTTDAGFGGVFEAVRQQLIDLVIEVRELDADANCRLLLRGWVAFIEAAIFEWLADPQMPREELIDIFLKIYDDIIARWSALGSQQ